MDHRLTLEALADAGLQQHRGDRHQCDHLRASRRSLTDSLERSNAETGRGYRLDFSLGVLACGSEALIPVEQLLEQADALMYQDKRDKRARVR